ncbi:MAG TPA: hypothetical protein VKP13_11440 [Nitrospira sp.]|nr:hypothetical protein [Nitrospira sp.]
MEREKPEALPTNTLLLYYGMLAAPIAWIFDEGLSYMLNQHACSTGHFYVLHIITIVTAAVALSGLFVAFQQLLAAGHGNDDGGSTRDRAYFMARLGIATSLGFSLVILALAVPRWVLTPCD